MEAEGAREMNKLVPYEGDVQRIRSVSPSLSSERCQDDERIQDSSWQTKAFHLCEECVEHNPKTILIDGSTERELRLSWGIVHGEERQCRDVLY